MKRLIGLALLLAQGCGPRPAPPGAGAVDLGPASLAVSEIAVSPDGKSVAYTTPYAAMPDPGIYVVPLAHVLLGEGASIRPTLLVPKARALAWQHRGQGYLFELPDSHGGMGGEATTLWIGRLGSSERRRVARGWMGCWSPDDSEIAFVRGSSLHLLNVETGKERVLVRGGEGKRRLDPRWPAWSPDGREIALAGGDGRLWVVRAKDGKARPLTEASEAKSDMEPVFSPDGRHIAFTRGYYGKVISSDAPPRRHPLMLTHNLGLLDRRTGRVTWLTKKREASSDTDPQWLPDGRKLVFVRSESARPARLAFVTVGLP
jgi:dipeptidyl aminopeptidase/acylaminoacyl peptidase